MNRPRLLAVSAQAPWPIRGGFALRAAHLLEALGASWDVSLLVASDMDSAAATWPDPERHEMVAVPVPPLGTAPKRPGPEILRSAAGALVRERIPDAALLFPGTEFLAREIGGIGAGGAGPLALPPGRTPSPRIIADRIDSGTLERWRYIRRARYLRGIEAVFETASEARYERRLAREVGAVTVVGEDDARALRRVSGRDSVHVIHNGVAPADGPAFELEDARPTVAFTGTLSYYANADAARYLTRRLWPVIRRHVPDARLVLAGRSPGRSIERLGAGPGVEVLADVPDMSEVLRNAWVAVAPMRCGAGVKNKVLEAWAVGRPAVLTPIGANGLVLDAAAGELVAGRSEELCELIVRLLEDGERRHAAGRAARDHVREHHTWRRSAEAMSRLLSANRTNG